MWILNGGLWTDLHVPDLAPDITVAAQAVPTIQPGSGFVEVDGIWQPPPTTFHWGQLISYQGIVADKNHFTVAELQQKVDQLAKETLDWEATQVAGHSHFAGLANIDPEDYADVQPAWTYQALKDATDIYNETTEETAKQYEVWKKNLIEAGKKYKGYATSSGGDYLIRTTLRSLVPGIEEWSDCPVEGCEDGYTVMNMVIHLNDQHAWSREAIADWLETLDVDLTLQPMSTGD